VEAGSIQQAVTSQRPVGGVRCQQPFAEFQQHICIEWFEKHNSLANRVFYEQKRKRELVRSEV